jgi:hypothetical protein
MKYRTNQLLCKVLCKAIQYPRACLYQCLASPQNIPAKAGYSFAKAAWMLACSVLFLAPMLAHAELKDISRIFRQTPTLSQFEVCQGGGCAQSNLLAISPVEWQNVSRIFSTKANNASDERLQISKAIAEFEKLVGTKNGTATDLAGTFNNSKTPGQLDCNDEAINTTTYLRLLQSNGLIQLHEVEDTRTRNFFFTGWPHTTAVIHEIKTGERFAVDSWFYDNGHAAAVVTFKQWKANYQPEDSPIK